MTDKSKANFGLGSLKIVTETISKYDGKCRVCNTPIKPGDKIVKVSVDNWTDWIHKSCSTMRGVIRRVINHQINTNHSIIEDSLDRGDILSTIVNKYSPDNGIKYAHMFVRDYVVGDFDREKVKKYRLIKDKIDKHINQVVAGEMKTQVKRAVEMEKKRRRAIDREKKGKGTVLKQSNRQTKTDKQTKRGRDLDKKRLAMTPGKRSSYTGKTYYEHRVNRSDLDWDRPEKKR